MFDIGAAGLRVVRAFVLSALVLLLVGRSGLSSLGFSTDGRLNELKTASYTGSCTVLSNCLIYLWTATGAGLFFVLVGSFSAEPSLIILNPSGGISYSLIAVTPSY